MIASNRIVSIDVFRGLTIAAMLLVNFPGLDNIAFPPLIHSQWNGITPADFIFPFFIFIAGVSIALSYTRQLEAQKPKKEMVKKNLWRAFKLYAIGMSLFYLSEFNFHKVDVFGVLQRISIVYMICGILFIYSDWKIHLSCFMGILVVYWITLNFIPFDGHPIGTLEPGLNFTAWIDRLFIPLKILGRHGWNTEGPYSTFSSVATGLAGLLTGQLIIRKKITEQTVIILIITGIVFVLLGGLWDWQFPINKKLWTSSFVLYTAGWALIFMGISLWLIDINGFKNNLFSHICVIFGTNAIAVYAMGDIFGTIYGFTGVQEFVCDSLLDSAMDYRLVSLVWSIIVVSSCFFVANIMYRKKIFLKI